MTDKVVCPEKISSPHPMYDWIPPNMPCGQEIPVRKEAEAMDFRCPLGHRFIATPKDIVRG